MTGRRTAALVAAIVVGLVLASRAHAALQITEIMFDPRSSEAGSLWEWFELRNTSAAAIDLDGFWVDDFGPAPGRELADGGSTYPNIVSATSSNPAHAAAPTKSLNTLIPAGGVAVAYNAALGVDESRFRAAWNLAPSVPLIAVSSFPTLNNGSEFDGFGLWPTQNAQDLDTVLEDLDNNPVTPPTRRIATLTNATAAVDYRVGFPASSNAASIAWNGTGGYATGANWSLSVSGTGGAYQSTPTFIAGTEFLNAADIGNPGRVPGGTAPNSLLITEIMFNPLSDEPAWEWIELYNGTASTVNLAGYVLDDDGGAKMAAANIAAGSIAPGSTAILFNGTSNTAANMQAAWGNELNLVAVTNWGSINLVNTGETIGLWDSLGDYNTETVTGPGRTFNNAAAVLTYDSVSPWPSSSTSANASSSYLINLGATGANGLAANGIVWAKAGAMGDTLSYTATLIPADVGDVDNSGLDIGSPGTVPFGSVVLAADFNSDGRVDAADYTIWRDNLNTATGATTATGDANGDGAVNSGDYAIWKSQFGSTSSLTLAAENVPEPATCVLLAMLISVRILVARRRIEASN